MKIIVVIFATLAWAVVTPAFAGATTPVVLFDQAHDQRFLIEKVEPLQLSGLAAIMGAEGLVVRSSSKTLSDESLKGVDALVISGPFATLDPKEVDAVVRFIERGGKMAVMLHIGSPFAGLLQRLEVNFTNYVLYEQDNIIDGDSLNFQVKGLDKSPLFAGIDHFSFYGGWALMNSAPAVKIIASTSPRAWVDVNGDKSLSTGDAIGSFGVVASGDLGTGRFVVFGDDAIFQNRFLDGQNRQLATNLARWLK